MQSLLLILALVALAATQALAGGRQLVLCLPGYGLLALAALLSWWPKRRQAIRGEVTECIAVAGLFFAYIAIRALCSPEAYLARNDLFTALGAMALYLLVALNLTSPKVRLWFVAGLLALGAANCAVGAVQFFRESNFMLFSFLPRPDYGSRASGFYGYPNHFAGFLEITALMGLAAAFWSRWPSWGKMLAGYTSLVCLLTLLATGSRGGYISVTIGLMVFGLLSLVLIGKLASNRAVGLIVAGVLLIGGIGWGVHYLMANSFLLHSRGDQTLTVDTTRVRMWQAAWKQSRIHPLVGTGSGTYLIYGRQFRDYSIQADPVHVHDDYFELLAEYGILGIIAMVIFLETHLRHGWNSLVDQISEDRKSGVMASDSLALTVGALSATIACLVQSFLDFNLHMPANVLVMAFVLGALTDDDEQSEPAGSPEANPGLPAFFRFALPAVGIWIAVQVLPLAPSEYYAERARDALSDWRRLVSPDAARELETLARRGLEWNPSNPELYFALGEAQSNLGDQATDPAAKDAFYTQSVDAYRKALEFSPREVSTVLSLAGSLDALRRFSESEPLFQRALELDPGSSSVHNAYAAHLDLEGKLVEAAAHFRLASQLGGGPASEIGLERVTDEQKTKSPP